MQSSPSDEPSSWRPLSRRLDPLHREVILLRDIRELSAPEAAAQLGISLDALKSRLHRARVRLRDHVLSRAHEA
jgi:DNA-directed RNA polymerase specialized sigma24 family protein